MITETLMNDKSLNVQTTNKLIKSIPRFVARMFPLIKVLLDLGGTAAQVLHPLYWIAYFYRQVAVSRLQPFYAAPLRSWKSRFTVIKTNLRR